jgi:hypothetical protein
MPSFEAWWAEEQLRPPADYAVELAAARTLRPSDQLFLATDRDVEEHAAFLDVEPELAHALVLALRDRPKARRLELAIAFYAARRQSGRRDPLDWEPPPRRPALAVGATAAARVVELAEPPSLREERVVDLLTGAAQGDDLTSLPQPAAAELGRVLSAAVSDLASSDPLEPGAAAGRAVVEVLAPASGEVGLQEVLLRATWAALRSWDDAAVLALLVETDAAYVPE